MELLPIVMIPVTATVPPPMVRVAIAGALVVAAELEFRAIVRDPKVADPVPPEAIKLSVPVIDPETWVVPVRAPRRTLVALSVPFYGPLQSLLS
jgi:hypothetical protein